MELPLSKTLMHSYQWWHVLSEDNTADVISRGLDAKDILSCNACWCGTNILREENYWCVEKHPVELEDNSDYAAELNPVQDYNLTFSTHFSIYKYLLILTNNI